MPTNVLLLQGPMGPFFSLFAQELREAGNTVHKINFNGGDDWFYDDASTHRFTGKLDTWEDYFSEQLYRLKIKQVYLFGDCRVYHAKAREIALAKDVQVFVFEEGYIRPNCITLEEVGVNGHSRLPKKPDHYPYMQPLDQDALESAPNSYRRTARYAVTYYVAARLMAWRYPHYQHHRPLKIFSEGFKWLVGAWRKFLFSLDDPETVDPLLNDERTPYFICPLQVSTDMQIHAHSRFLDMEEFIQDVIHSFANHAPKNAKVVFKHHPLDRGYHDYKRVIKVLSKLHGIQDRVLYIHECDLPELLKKAKGTITINSTVGLSSLYHGTPVIALGDAVYNLEGLCHKESLDRFWTAPTEIDVDLYHRFRSYLLENNQANGSFYAKLASTTTATGINWPASLARQHGLQSGAPLPVLSLDTKSAATEQTAGEGIAHVAPQPDLGKHYNGQSTGEDSTAPAELNRVDLPHPATDSATLATEA